MPETVKISEEEHAFLLEQREVSLRRIETEKSNVRSIEKRLGLNEGNRQDRRAAAHGVER